MYLLKTISRFSFIQPQMRWASRAAAESPAKYHISVASEEEMNVLGESLASLSSFPDAGDVLFLFGPLGSGKSVLARAMIRYLLCNPEAHVPSPSYLLSQTYQIAKISEDLEERDDLLDLHHIDLYRLEDPAEGSGAQKQLRDPMKMKHMLDLKRIFQDEVAIVEWPSRLAADHWPACRLEIHISIDPESQARLVEMIPFGSKWSERLQQD